MMAMIPTKMESKMTWDAVQNEFGSTESIFIAFGKEGKNIFNKEALSQLWDVTRALEKIKEIEKVNSISNIPKILSNDGFLEIEDLQKNRDLSKHTTEDIANYVNANSTIKNRMVSKHEDYFNIIIQPLPNVSHDILRHRVVQVGDSLLSVKYDRKTLEELLQIDRVDIDEILRKCNFSASFIKGANDLQILEAISGCYDEYKILNR